MFYLHSEAHRRLNSGSYPPPSVYPFYRLPIAEFTSLKMSRIRKELRLHDACDNIPKLLSTLTYT